MMHLMGREPGGSNDRYLRFTGRHSYVPLGRSATGVAVLVVVVVVVDAAVRADLIA
jgi:hypothetical protein